MKIPADKISYATYYSDKSGPKYSISIDTKVNILEFQAYGKSTVFTLEDIDWIYQVLGQIKKELEEEELYNNVRVRYV